MEKFKSKISQTFQLSHVTQHLERGFASLTLLHSEWYKTNCLLYSSTASSVNIEVCAFTFVVRIQAMDVGCLGKYEEIWEKPFKSLCP